MASKHRRVRTVVGPESGDRLLVTATTVAPVAAVATTGVAVAAVILVAAVVTTVTVPVVIRECIADEPGGDRAQGGPFRSHNLLGTSLGVVNGRATD